MPSELRQEHHTLNMMELLSVSFHVWCLVADECDKIVKNSPRVLVAMSAIFWKESKKAVDAAMVPLSCAWNFVDLMTKSSQFWWPDFMSWITSWNRDPMAEQSRSTAIIDSIDAKLFNRQGSSRLSSWDYLVSSVFLNVHTRKWKNQNREGPSTLSLWRLNQSCRLHNESS